MIVEEIDELLPEISRACRFHLENYSRTFLQRRFEYRMRRLGIPDLKGYLSYMKENAAEAGILLGDLSINVTSFFRDKSMYDAFMLEPLFEMLKDKDTPGKRNIRVWSAGCASGEETYSIAISFIELLGQRLKDFRIEIIGTDLDEEALETARHGVYPIERLKEAEQGILGRYFVSDGSTYAVREEVKALVTYNKGDILSPLKPKNLDIIFCRNVVIYFDKETKEKLFVDFYSCLNKKGLLILGKTETMTGPAREMFRIKNLVERMYIKD